MTLSDQIHTEFGQAIRDERIRQGLSVADMAERLRAPETSIVAVETGDIKAFPSETYFQLFAKSYSRELGVDYSRTIDALSGQEEELEATEYAAPEQPDHLYHRPVARSHNAISIMQRPGFLFSALAVVTVALLLIAKFVRTGNEATGEGKLMTAGIGDEFDSSVLSGPADSTYVMRLRVMTSDSTNLHILLDDDTLISGGVFAGKSFTGNARRMITIYSESPSAVSCSINGHLVVYDSSNSAEGALVITPENVRSKLELHRSPFVTPSAPVETVDSSTSTKQAIGAPR